MRYYCYAALIVCGVAQGADYVLPATQTTFNDVGPGIHCATAYATDLDGDESGPSNTVCSPTPKLWEWQAPTENTDGSPLTDLDSYRLSLAVQLEAPGAIDADTSMDWAHSHGEGNVSFAYTEGEDATGSGTSASVTLLAAPSEGDLVVAYVSTNMSSGTLSSDDGMTEGLEETPSGKTARHAMYWLVAGASEPSTYSVTLTQSAGWGMWVKVFTSASDAEEDVSERASHIQGSADTNLIMGAINGRTTLNNSLSVIGGGMDNRAALENYTTADNSFVSVLGQSDNQVTGGAHRIYTTDGETVSYDVSITATSVSSETYSIHMSFVEGGGAGATPKGVFSNPFSGPFGGPI